MKDAGDRAGLLFCKTKIQHGGMVGCDHAVTASSLLDMQIWVK